ncbi:MAG: phosphoserine transaminase [Microbacteriaceae bacterium]|jgi:phosphoserine aminotransferase|nr:phosphoserine transaminase [Microbacteriaceae bacterium]
MADITIPQDLLPRDGRFGAGPSRVSSAQLDHLVRNASLLGTSHRQAPVRELVGRIQGSLGAYFRLPEGYEVVLGNGGSTAFWDIAAASLARTRSAHLSFGEFGAKCVSAHTTPWLEKPHVVTSEPGTRGELTAVAGVDLYAWPHNETSTGVMAPVKRIEGADSGALMMVDATSAAGGLDFDASEVDVYYFAPQKNFASDGGLWFALLSPAALERAAEIAATDRYIPDFLSLTQAIDNSRLNQTLNTPALTTLLLMESQLEWMMSLGGLTPAAEHCTTSSSLLYDWADSRSDVTPFVADPDHRSRVVVTLDLDDAIDATAITGALRANGVVDTEPYRKLGRNQIRVATFVGVPTSDVELLIASLDYVLENL